MFTQTPRSSPCQCLPPLQYGGPSGGDREGGEIGHGKAPYGIGVAREIVMPSLARYGSAR